MKKNKKIKSFLFLAAAFVLVLTACSVEAKSLKKGEVYQTLDGKQIIEVISKNELDIKSGAKIILAEYGFKGDKLRVVFGIAGTKMVEYYEIIKKGLKDNNGNILYSKASYAAWTRAQEEKKKKIIEKSKKALS